MKYDKNSHQITPSGTPAHPEQTVPNTNTGDSLLKSALLTECHELVRLMKYNHESGYSFWPHIPEPFNHCGNCTTGAKFIAQKFGGYVAGYEIDAKQKTFLVGANAGGHDFAIVGEFIVDWWGWYYEGLPELPVITRAEGVARELFKPEQDWKTVPELDFQPNIIIHPARITYENWLAKYRPIKNPFDKNAPFDGSMFETYGDALQFVCSQNSYTIWTLIESEGKIRLCNGLRFVNRLGYFITEFEAPLNRTFSIKAD